MYFYPVFAKGLTMPRVSLISLYLLLSVFSLEGALRDDFQDAPEARLDSLRMLVEEQTVSDSLFMDALLNYAWSIRSSNPGQALAYARRGLAIAENNDYHLVAARALTDIGLIYWRMGNFTMAYDFILEARQIFEREGYEFGVARVITSMGIIFSGQGYYDNALEYHFRALRIYEESDSIARTASVLNNIGTTYYRQGDYEMAEVYHMRSLEIKEYFGDERGKAFSLNNLGQIYKARGQYPEALEHYLAALEIREKLKETRERAQTTRNIGYLYFKMGNHSEAIENLNVARELFVQVNDHMGIALVYHQLGEVYADTGSLIRADRFYNESLRIAIRIGSHSLIADNYRKLSELMAQRGNYESAYNLQKQFLAIQDSIYDEESRRRVIELQLMYDRERKEGEIELLRKVNQINELNLEKQRLLRNFLLLFLALILVTLFIIYNRFLAISKANTQLELQKIEIVKKNKKLQDLNTKIMEQKKEVEELNTKLRISETNLLEINKTKDKFFSIISHDLRNPFASIVSFSRILKRDIKNLTIEELQQLAMELDKSVLKINSLLENLLQWSRSQTGKISYNPESFQLKDIIRDNVNLFSGPAREKGLEISDRVTNDVVVWGDVNMTNTIVRNLLSNAIKYTPSGGSIHVSSKQRNGMLEISVTDSGVGISPENQQKLFRVDTLHTTFGTHDEKGSGLGLLLCKEFVEKQGGSISIQSEPGKGSVFTFTIPLPRATS